MSPAYKMLYQGCRYREATLAEISDALYGARCSARLAGLQTDDFVVRELLLVLIQQIDQAAAAVRRLA